jgi:NADH-quinone oxidoreductase subunit A
MLDAVLPLFLFVACVVLLAVFLLLMGNFFNPKRPGPVKGMPYESGMDPIHDSRRRFNVRFHLVAIAFLVFDVELLFLYPWAVAFRSQAASVDDASSQMEGDSGAGGWLASEASHGEAEAEKRPPLIFLGGMIFVGLLVLGFVYDWRKGVFQWR